MSFWNLQAFCDFFVVGGDFVGVPFSWGQGNGGGCVGDIYII